MIPPPEGDDTRDEASLEKVRDFYYVATAKAGDVARQLAFAGIAVVWLFGGGTDIKNIAIPNDLLWPGLAFVIALGLDLTQYAFRSAGFGHLQWKWHREGTFKGEIPDWLQRGSIWLFGGKVVATFAGYVLLGIALAERID